MFDHEMTEGDTVVAYGRYVGKVTRKDPTPSGRFWYQIDWAGPRRIMSVFNDNNQVIPARRVPIEWGF